MQDIDTIRAAVAVRGRSVFALLVLSENIGCRPHQLERFLHGGALPSEAMHKLVAELFNGVKSWNEATQTLIDVVKPVTAMSDTSQFPHGVINAGVLGR